MKVILNDNEYNTKDIHLVDGNRILSIFFAGTGDLHWGIINNDCTEEEYCCDHFEITKENYQVYSLFEKLFHDIKNINIFDKDIIEIPPYVETDEEKKEYLEKKELDKKRYKMFNMSHYNDLYNEESNTITWVSDETGFKVANVVSIKKEEDKFLLEFKTQPYIEGYEREYNTLGMIGIRFRNSGSRYDPFNIVFMRMFRELQNIDDINDYGHQIHIEEYLYKKGPVKKLTSDKK